jgi:hypothetical protein
MKTGAEVAIKIGHIGFSPSKLSHEHDVYKKIAGGAGISPIHWYGKEDIYEVIVLDFLGTSLDDMISTQQFDRRKTFFFASQMVCSLCIIAYEHMGVLQGLFHSSQQSSHCILDTTSIVTSSQETS